MFQVDKLLETITKRSKSQPTPRKFQRSPKIIGYERSEYPEITSLSDLKEPLLLSSSNQDYIDANNNNNDYYSDNNHQDMKSIKGVNNNKSNNNSVRVKVLLTKQEAAKLLAKCKEGGLDFKDVVNELVKLPAQRINVVSSVSNDNIISSKDLELTTILEEEE